MAGPRASSLAHLVRERLTTLACHLVAMVMMTAFLPERGCCVLVPRNLEPQKSQDP